MHSMRSASVRSYCFINRNNHRQFHCLPIIPLTVLIANGIVAVLKPLWYSLPVMPITKGARKALRQAATRKAANDRTTKSMKEAVKKVEKLVHAKKVDDAKKAVSDAYRAIDKAAKKGVIKKNTAGRKKSRLSRITKK
jgi:small subunit ribosomal protein S20